MSCQCHYIYKSGKKKGQQCAKPCEKHKEGEYCQRHLAHYLPSAASVFPKETLEYLNPLDVLKYKFTQLDTTVNNKAIIFKKLKYVETLAQSSTEYQKNVNWLNYALNFPYNRVQRLPVSDAAVAALTTDTAGGAEGDTDKVISDYVSDVYKKLDAYIYGLQEVKEELLSFICKRISNPSSNSNILALAGNNGCGKTRLASGISQALGLPMRMISLGSVHEVSHFTGHGLVYVESEPGQITKMLGEMQCKNGVIFFDELDKVHTEKGQGIYSFLTHLLDPTTNNKFQDLYLNGLELDVSQVFFIFSFNDESLIDATVKDRLKIVNIKEPSVDDKFNIAKKFIVPEICQNVNYNVDIDDQLIYQIVNTQSQSKGLRSIKRVLEDVIAKLNVVRMLDRDIRGDISYYDKSRPKMIQQIIDQHAAASNNKQDYRLSMYS